MKKIMVLALAAILLIGGVITVHAATTPMAPCAQQECFVDADNNGACDNRADCPTGKDCFVDADNDGTCDNRASCITDGTCPGNSQQEACPMGNQNRPMGGCRMGAARHGGNHHGK